MRFESEEIVFYGSDGQPAGSLRVALHLDLVAVTRRDREFALLIMERVTRYRMEQGSPDLRESGE